MTDCRRIVTDQQIEATNDDGTIVTVAPIKIVIGLSLDEVAAAKRRPDHG